MIIKEIDRTANVAWSPAAVDNIFMAVGTAAQQLDSSFSTDSVLEIYQFDISQTGLDIPVKATIPCISRFHKLTWGSYGMGEKGEHPMGIIAAGCDNGVMQIYDASKIMKKESPLVLTKSKHTGHVRALDFNPFRSNLIASGASESEIYIWDLTNPKTPMTPGTKVQPVDEVSHLAWNKQVEHILASTFSTRCVVWDLRKNEPVIKVSASTPRIRYKVVEWHPEVATQMCLASEDDNSPVIELWDLRYATAPLKVIQGHQRGILGMAWCPQDPDLLLTCGKDARILCWNPNYIHPGYEMLCDIPTSSQFSFDVSFCPKNPIVISSSSYDGRVSIFGLSGGVQHPVTSSKLADSFPGMDLSMDHTPLPSQQPALLQLRDAPKWLKRPCGASFAFGGKLISFHNVKTPSATQGQPLVNTGIVSISQLITLPNIIERSKKLEETLQSGSLESYCMEKAAGAGDSNESRIWEFLQANFSENPRQVYLSMLGFNTTEMLAKLKTFSVNNAEDEIVDSFQSLGRGAPDGYENGLDLPKSNGKVKESKPQLSIPTNDSTIDGKINQALLCGSIEVAVNLCLADERWADALLLANKGSPELLVKVQNKYFEKSKNEATQMVRAIVSHDLSSLVERSKLESWKQVLAVMLTYADSMEFSALADMLGQRLQESKHDDHKLGALLCFICSGNLNHLVDVWVGDANKNESDSPEELQALVEQVMILKKAGEHLGRETIIDGGSLAAKLVQYSNLLASQGCLETALSFLGDSNEPSISTLKERLYYSLRYAIPPKSQINPRSRQTSESAGGLRSISKRPSYPTQNIKRGSTDFMNPSDFSNLTGPAHPPNPYGNIYVNGQVSTGPSNPPGQYSPNQVAGMGYNASAGLGLPPRPPSTTPSGPGMYNNPNDVPINTYKPAPGPVADVAHPTRTPLGTSMQNIRRGSSGLMNPAEFSNLTGPAHPPNPYGNIYVNSQVSTGPINPPGQYSPNQIAGYNNASAGLQSRPAPSIPLSTMYNPNEAPINVYNPVAAAPVAEVVHPPARTPLGSSLPPPPVSSAAHGWNDPPPIKPSSKPKNAVTPSNARQPITHPIFGSAPEPVQALQGPPGMHPMDPYAGAMPGYPGQMNPPPPQGMGSMVPPPPIQNSSTYYGSPPQLPPQSNYRY